MRLEILPHVFPELFLSAEWYEIERRGLGADFLDEAANAIERVEANPLMFPLTEGDVRRAQLHRFPFGIFFTYNPEVVTVFCIVHLSRHASVWKKYQP
jgi:hypothetical protein